MGIKATLGLSKQSIKINAIWHTTDAPQRMSENLPDVHDKQCIIALDPEKLHNDVVWGDLYTRLKH